MSAPLPELTQASAGRVFFRRLHDRQDWQVIFAGEIEIALVVRRAGKDGTGAIAHQYEVRDIDRKCLAFRERMLDREARYRSRIFGAFSMSASEVPTLAHSARKSARSVFVSAMAMVKG